MNDYDNPKMDDLPILRINGSESEPTMISGGFPCQMHAPRSLPDVSHLRIQDSAGRDLVTLNMETGKITVLDPDRVDDAAKSFFEGIRFAWREGMRDLKIRSGGTHGGDIFFVGGRGQGPKARGGDLKIYPTVLDPCVGNVHIFDDGQDKPCQCGVWPDGESIVRLNGRRWSDVRQHCRLLDEEDKQNAPSLDRWMLVPYPMKDNEFVLPSEIQMLLFATAGETDTIAGWRKRLGRIKQTLARWWDPDKA